MPRSAGGDDRARPVGVALAGGSSRRLGDDKALLTHPDGGTLLDFTLARLGAVCEEVLVASRGRHPHPASVEDGPGAGPAAGILGAARVRPGRSLLVLACDLPDVPAALLAHLCRRAGGEAAGREAGGAHALLWDWVVPAHPHIEPLCALYAPRALETLERRVERGRFSLHGLLDEPALRLLRLDEDELAHFGSPATLFRNLNTPQDVTRWHEQGAAPGAQPPSAGGSGDEGEPSSAHSRRRKSKR